MTPELQTIFDDLPEYQYLIPKKDKWKENDELLGAKYTDNNEPAWITVVNSKADSIITTHLPCRRLIPIEVRKAQAWWIYAQKKLSISLLYQVTHTVVTGSRLMSEQRIIDLLRLHKVDPEVILNIGPGTEYILKGPNVYEQWLEDNRK